RAAGDAIGPGVVFGPREGLGTAIDPAANPDCGASGDAKGTARPAGAGGRLRRWTAASGRRACSASRAGSALSVTGGPAQGGSHAPFQAPRLLMPRQRRPVYGLA